MNSSLHFAVTMLRMNGGLLIWACISASSMA